MYATQDYGIPLNMVPGPVPASIISWRRPRFGRGAVRRPSQDASIRAAAGRIDSTKDGAAIRSPHTLLSAASDNSDCALPSDT